MTRSEQSIQNGGLVNLSAEPAALYYRNNTGQAWQGTRLPVSVGQFVKVEPNMVILREARPLKFGLPGSSDVLGVQQGRAVAVEFKTAIGRQSAQQKLFERAWTLAGGIYVLARSPDTVVEQVHAAVKLKSREVSTIY